ncbi:hypothetical protein [Candidatus Villigracilis saccharophilus]|uniref:hypothetical protein n=1 Tax=Candidatus Villigracilis saccharophilus TaxID=3140684 RepID=UPI003136426A|nr:hypothetical protein [Anaerolineales bacterium]
MDAVGRSTFILYGVAMTVFAAAVDPDRATTWLWTHLGPIADNANGIGEASWVWEARRYPGGPAIMADPDAVGNTTQSHQIAGAHRLQRRNRGGFGLLSSFRMFRAQAIWNVSSQQPAIVIRRGCSCKSS